MGSLGRGNMRKPQRADKVSSSGCYVQEIILLSSSDDDEEINKPWDTGNDIELVRTSRKFGPSRGAKRRRNSMDTIQMLSPAPSRVFSTTPPPSTSSTTPPPPALLTFSPPSAMLSVSTQTSPISVPHAVPPSPSPLLQPSPSDSAPTELQAPDLPPSPLPIPSPLPQPAPSSLQAPAAQPLPATVVCPYCERTYGRKTFLRHVKDCPLSVALKLCWTCGEYFVSCYHHGNHRHKHPDQVTKQARTERTGRNFSKVKRPAEYSVS